MKAIVMHEFGGPEVLHLEDAPVPECAPDEVLIKVYASSVNPVDQKIRAGEAQQKFPTNFPLTIGWDVSGVVEKTGSKVYNPEQGDEVYGRPDPTKNGAFAEYIIVKANQVSLKPNSLSHVEAASVPLAALTAWQGLFTYGKLEADQRVLIHGASGGVGIFAVQFAKWIGAYTIGTTSGDNIDFVKDMGADDVIDYKNEKFEEVLSDIDLVFDTRGGDTQQKSLQVLKKGGRLITTIKVEHEAEAKEKGIYIEGFTAQSYPADLEQIARLIDAGDVKPSILKVFPLAEARQAEELSEQGHAKGKIVVQVV